jgi:hypothetical protein
VDDKKMRAQIAERLNTLDFSEHENWVRRMVLGGAAVASLALGGPTCEPQSIATQDASSPSVIPQKPDPAIQAEYAAPVPMREPTVARQDASIAPRVDAVSKYGIDEPQTASADPAIRALYAKEMPPPEYGVARPAYGVEPQLVPSSQSASAPSPPQKNRQKRQGKK